MFTRTTTSAPPRPASGSASATRRRALAFSAGGTESSRSSTMASAPRSAAFSTKRGTFTGRISDEPPRAEPGRAHMIPAPASDAIRSLE